MRSNSILCSKSEADKIVAELQLDADKACTDFNRWCNPSEEARLEVKASQFTMGWEVTAILYFGSEVMKVYPLAELALIDIQSLTLRAMQKLCRTWIGEDNV